MTNRKDLLDEALLRPGRLEVQVEISLPDENGRFQILQIHTNKMEENSFLAPDINLQELDNFRSPLHGSNEQLAEHAMTTDKEGNLAGGDWILVDGGERERDLFRVSSHPPFIV